MRKLRLVVLERDMRRVARALGELGVVHLRSSLEEGRGRLVPEALDEEVARCRSLMARLNALMTRLDVQPAGRAVGPVPVVGMEQAEELARSLGTMVERPSEELAKTQRALSETEALVGELAPYRELKGPVRPLLESAFLEVKVGSVAPRDFERMQAAMPDGVLMLPLGDQWAGAGRPAELLVVSGRRRRFAMDTVLTQHGFQEKPAPAWEDRTPADVYREAVEQVKRLHEQAKALQAGLRAMGQPYAEALRDAVRALSVQLRLDEAAQKFGATWATAVISGWIPAGREDELRNVVVSTTGGQAVIEIAPPDAADIEQGRVPSYVVHSSFFMPFEKLVRGYGVASYTEIEPTVLFTVTFLLMFGIIFGDLGHGLCLLVAGLLVRKLARGAAAKDVGHVVAAAGAATMAFGTFLQGSFFGRSLADMGFPLTLGFEPMRLEGQVGSGADVMRYLVLALALGTVVISLGAVLNIINRLRRRDYGEGLLGRFGLVGVIFYWGALGLGIKEVVAGSGKADVWLALVAVGLPLLVLIFHEPLHMLLTHGTPAWSDGVVMGFSEGLIEAMETVMVYLANTFSFLRIAAFALSHAALCFTIFVLERLVNGLPGGFLWGAVVFILGTVVVIALEGLIVAIQIVRLEYYEFFTKFFGGEGIRYEPFRLE